ncbi:MAG: hypothetical protein ABSG84_09010 [Acidobacteriaceae bacterium]
MEDVELVVIPTMSKVKISKDLSYPIGAEAISRAVEGVRQFPLLRLRFHYWSDNSFRRGEYEFLRVEYLDGVTPPYHPPVTPLYQRPPQYRWEIVVQPVPRVHRHRIKTYIVESALGAVREWLLQRDDFVQNGSDILAFFYEEKLDEFKTYRVENLEPVR